MYLQYCLTASIVICALSIILFYILKKKNQTNMGNTITLVFCTMLAIICATFAPIISNYFINRLNFSVVGSVLASIVILLALALAVFYLIPPKVIKRLEEKMEKTEEKKSESIVEKIISAFASQSRQSDDENVERNNNNVGIAEAGSINEETNYSETEAIKDIESPTTEIREEAEQPILESPEEEMEQITESPEDVEQQISVGLEEAIQQISEGPEEAIEQITESPEDVEQQNPDGHEEAIELITESMEDDVEQKIPESLDSDEPIFEDLMYIPDEQSDISELIDRAMDSKISHNYQDAILAYERALVLNPDDELCYLIILDLCSLYKITEKSESIYILLESARCKLLTLDKKEDILRNIKIS